MINLEFTPHRAAILQNHDNRLQVLLRAHAPSMPAGSSRRTPLNLAVVIDRSGSMHGQPLEEAKKCAAMVVDRLDKQDRLAVVTYDNVVEVIVPSTRVENRGIFEQAIAAISSRGTTALHAGWLSGAEEVVSHHGEDVLSRVMLLSDGQANEGVIDPDQIARDCAEMASAGVGTSTYGLSVHFNEDLMTAMARGGRGNAYYGQTAQDLMDPFQEEFDLLQAIYARNLRLRLEPAAGVTAVVKNGYQEDREGNIIMPDLAYDGEAWALIELTIPKNLVSHDDRPVTVLTAHLVFEDVEGQRRSDTIRLKLPPLPASAFETIAPDPTVTSRAAELLAAELQEEARGAARRGDWRRVESVMLRLEAESVNSPWLAATLDSLRQYARQRRTEEFSKEALYKSHKMRSRLASADEAQPWSADLEDTKVAYLRRKLEQGRRFGDRQPPSD